MHDWLSLSFQKLMNGVSYHDQSTSQTALFYRLVCDRINMIKKNFFIATKCKQIKVGTYDRVISKLRQGQTVRVDDH